MNKDKNTICPLPFVHPFFDVRGWFTACCNANAWDYDSDEHVSKMTAQEWFYGEKMMQLRDDLKNGVRNPMCQECWKREDENLDSPRLGAIREWSDRSKVKTEVDYDNPRPTYFDLKPSNHCNLACIFCGPSASDKIIKVSESLPVNQVPNTWNQYKETKDFYNTKKTFDPEVLGYIKDNIKDIQVLKFTGGEPFLNDQINEILKLVAEHNPEVYIVITTNGTVIKKEFYPVLQKLKNTRIKFSIDGVEDIYNYVRWSSKWNTFSKKIDNTMKSLPNIKFNINCLVTSMNVEQLPKIRNWFKEQKSKYSNLQFITFDPGLNPDNGYYSIRIYDKETLEKLQAFLTSEFNNYDAKDYTCDNSLILILNKIKYILEHNTYDVKLHSDLLLEMQKQNNIRNINFFEIAMPITKQFFTKIRNEQ